NIGLVAEAHAGKNGGKAGIDLVGVFLLHVIVDQDYEREGSGIGAQLCDLLLDFVLKHAKVVPAQASNHVPRLVFHRNGNNHDSRGRGDLVLWRWRGTRLLLAHRGGSRGRGSRRITCGGRSCGWGILCKADVRREQYCQGCPEQAFSWTFHRHFATLSEPSIYRRRAAPVRKTHPMGGLVASKCLEATMSQNLRS